MSSGHALGLQIRFFMLPLRNMMYYGFKVINFHHLDNTVMLRSSKLQGQS